MRTEDFDYDLPPHAIAQEPAARRDAARLLVDGGPDAPAVHATVADLAGFLEPADLLVVNTTRVLPARLRLRKVTGGAVEVLLVAALDDGGRRWRAMVRPSRRVAPGSVLHPWHPDGPELSVVVGAHLGDGLREVCLEGGGDAGSVADLLAGVGEVPLPPYVGAVPVDPDRYQTVYARRAASVAAPTAGLHLTEAVLGACADKGVGVAEVELDIGPGTFVPVTTDDVEDHTMHAEHYSVPAETQASIADVHARGGSVVAVGTTVVRALESWAATGEDVGDTALYLTPGYRFQVVDRLMTNFHLPRSTLLVLLEAFMGPRWRGVYADALARGYRFLSFGDAMVTDALDPPRHRLGPSPGELA